MQRHAETSSQATIVKPPLSSHHCQATIETSSQATIVMKVQAHLLDESPAALQPRVFGPVSATCAADKLPSHGSTPGQHPSTHFTQPFAKKTFVLQQLRSVPTQRCSGRWHEEPMWSSLPVHKPHAHLLALHTSCCFLLQAHLLDEPPAAPCFLMKA
jgi:hypothetical protein